MKAGDCRHFTGCQNEKCKADVNYRKLVGGPDFGWAARLPCLPNSPLRKPPIASCEKFDALTKAEADAEMKEIKERSKFLCEAIAMIRKTGKPNGKIVCPKCTTGDIGFSVAKSNGHVWGKCSTEGCLAWMM